MENRTEDPGKTVFFSRTNVEVKLSPIHRYGVFAAKNIAPQELIEECPLIISQYSAVADQEELSNRAFFWDDNNCAFALGYGLIYNHGNKPNADFKIDRKNRIIKFIATKPIPIGTEISIDYGEEWFATRDPAIKRKLQEKKNNYGLMKVMALFVILLILSLVFPTQSTMDSKPKPTSNSSLSKST